jgi:hypothetical protein
LRLTITSVSAPHIPPTEATKSLTKVKQNHKKGRLGVFAFRFF